MGPSKWNGNSVATLVQDVAITRFEPSDHSNSSGAQEIERGSSNLEPLRRQHEEPERLDQTGSRNHQARLTTTSNLTNSSFRWDAKMKNLDHYLDGLPISSVAEKHMAKFECELDKGSEAPMVSTSRFSLSRSVVNLTSKLITNNSSYGSNYVATNEMMNPERDFRLTLMLNVLKAMIQSYLA